MIISSAVAVLAIALLTQLVKGYITPKFGATGVHIFIFILGLIGAAVTLGIQNSATFAHIVEVGMAYLGSAVALYEVLLKQIGIDNISTGPTSTLG